MRRGPAVLAVALVFAAALGALLLAPAAVAAPPPSDAQIVEAFGKQGMRINPAEARGIRADVLLALEEARANGFGSSKVDFAAVEIASGLGLDTSPGSNTVRNVLFALRYLSERGFGGTRPHVTPPTPPPPPPPPPRPPVEWFRYFDHTVNLWNDGGFLGLVRQRGFHPVKISWEDIGRYENSVWGDRISDVGIWVRRDEGDPASARLALSVRRDSNFRDKVLMVPAEKIKVHRRLRGRTVERTLPERLAELGLQSRNRDRNVIVSNQFAIVPVPGRGMRGAWPEGVPPRAAFTFSIFPYGSTNMVVTDVIEGSHEALVGPGQHQLLFANVGGQKAPFTASRAEDRQDLLKLERDLKAQGMDVDVQRYYLIQVPLRKGTTAQPANMGTPPWGRAAGGVVGGITGGLEEGAVAGTQPLPQAAPPPPSAVTAGAPSESKARSERPGLTRVAIGHGEVEGPYSAGSGWRGERAEEPIRVTVVYFVTPVGEVTRKDMESFAAAFEQWDGQAIWGGSFVVKDSQ